MTPEWSRALAVACQSPIWRGLTGMERKAAFVEAASQYATYDEMPHDLQMLYDRATRRLRSPRRR